jgi:hypothetical protein
MATSTSLTTITPACTLDLIAAFCEQATAFLAASAHHGDLKGAEVVEVAELLGIDFAAAPFSVEDLQVGMEVELDLGYECAPSMVDALDEDLVEIGKVAVAHLQERSDYYRQLTAAHAPGDPPALRHRHADVGGD